MRRDPLPRQPRVLERVDHIVRPPLFSAQHDADGQPRVGELAARRPRGDGPGRTPAAAAERGVDEWVVAQLVGVTLRVGAADAKPLIRGGLCDGERCLARAGSASNRGATDLWPRVRPVHPHARGQRIDTVPAPGALPSRVARARKVERAGAAAVRGAPAIPRNSDVRVRLDGTRGRQATDQVAQSTQYSSIGRKPLVPPRARLWVSIDARRAGLTQNQERDARGTATVVTGLISRRTAVGS